MQAIAHEMGFSETAFVTEVHPDEGCYTVRIFTPDVELPFAGHPVIGTSHVLIEKFGLGDGIRLDLEAGCIPVRCENGILSMVQNQPTFGMEIPAQAVAEAISLPRDLVDERLPVQLVSTGLEAIILPLESRECLDGCRVNHEAMRRVHDAYAKCSVLAFAVEDGAVYARVFMDDAGFLEDPATGSANGCLAAYVLRYGIFDRSCSYIVRQGVQMGRLSTLYVDASLEDERYRIEVGGKAFTVARGEWL